MLKFDKTGKIEAKIYSAATPMDEILNNAIWEINSRRKHTWSTF